MSKKNTKIVKPQKVVVNVTPKTKNRPRRSKMSRASPWLRSLLDPFTYGAVHIPDERTVSSGLVTSKLNLRASATAISGTSTTHNFAMIIPPHINAGIFQADETVAANGLLQDVTTLGTAYNRRTLWPNAGAAVPGTAKHRLVSLGVRVIYEGTELNRSARIMAGCMPSVAEGFSINSTGTIISPSSTILNTATPNITNYANGMINVVETRSDGVLDAHWVPNGIPFYQLASANPAGLLTNTATGSNLIPNSFFNCAPGSGGVEAGQNVFVVFIEADTVSAAAGNGNVYSFEFIAHWEVIPHDPTAVAYQITPSPYVVSELSSALNSIGNLPSGQVRASHSNTVLPTSDYLSYLPSLDTMRQAYGIAKTAYGIVQGDGMRANSRMLEYY
jgi:hypothetical protein